MATTEAVWCTPAELAKWLGVHQKTLASWRKQGKGPRFLKEGRTIRYAWHDIYGWVNTCRKESR